MPGRASRIGTAASALCRTIAVAALLAAAGVACADELPLHERIDRAIRQSIEPAELRQATDAEFMRRIFLDLIGVIPTSGEVRAFLADQAADRRAKLIDRLLADPRFPRHMATVFDVMLMERRAAKYVKSPEWEQYLLSSFRENKPINQLAREILAANGADAKLVPAARFYLDREAETNQLTRDVGRIFFGRDMQCAQCHDHPEIDDYLQTDYYGIYAFLNRSYLFNDKKAKRSVLAEKAEGEAKFQSVFDPTSKGTMLPKLPGSPPIAEPVLKKEEQYKVKPAKGVAGVPAYSRRRQLAASATNGENEALNRNFANRLWAHMMGRGLVEPVDLHHSANPPTHPELLDALSRELVVQQYNLKTFLRELALSRVYQRSLDPPEKLGELLARAAAQTAGQTEARQKLETSAAASLAAVEKIGTELSAARESVATATAELTKAKAPEPKAKQAADAAAKRLAEVTSQLTAKQGVADVLAEAATKTKAAAAKLADDKELADAAGTFQQRSQQFAAEVAALTKTADAQKAATKTATDALAAIHGKLAELTGRIENSKKQVAALLGQQTTARAEMRSQYAAIEHLERQLTYAGAMAEFAKLKSAVAASETALQQIRTKQAASEQNATQAAAALEQAKKAQLAAQNQSAESQAKVTQLQTGVTAKQGVLTTVAEALAKAHAASSKVPDDKELAEATGQVKARHDKLAAELAVAQQALAAAQQAAKSAAERTAAAQKQQAGAAAQLQAAQQQIKSLAASLKPAEDRLAANRAAAEASETTCIELWSDRFVVQELQPLTPEQLTWSILQATGLIERQRTASAAELEKKKPLDEAARKDPAQVAARAREVEAQVFEKLKGNAAAFVSLFSAGPGQPQYDFFATVDQALFFANGSQLRGWLAPSGGNLTDRLVKLEDPKALAEELYLSVLSRTPADDEAADVAQYLAARPDDRPVAVGELIWALITSTEFRFNH